MSKRTAEQAGDTADFAPLLLAWYAREQRDLPWRRTRDPYAIWISETMLQQTQVATVIPYWTRWLHRFPTVVALAQAPLDDVLKAWQGLGYYARARNLHRAAQVIVEKHGGVFPTRLEDVLALPGVGRYTAGAVCSIAFDQDVPIVDANVIRVLCRVFGVRGDPKSTKSQAELWRLAEALIPPGQARPFNQAMMELGALVCHQAPRCGVCPVRERCVAYQSGDPTGLPEFAPRAAFTQQTDVSALVQQRAVTRVLMHSDRWKVCGAACGSFHASPSARTRRRRRALSGPRARSSA
jgi:A/G-specific adenine glycosylase